MFCSWLKIVGRGEIKQGSCIKFATEAFWLEPQMHHFKEGIIKAWYVWREDPLNARWYRGPILRHTIYPRPAPFSSPRTAGFQSPRVVRHHLFPDRIKGRLSSAPNYLRIHYLTIIAANNAAKLIFIPCNEVDVSSISCVPGRIRYLFLSDYRTILTVKDLHIGA